jgi:tetratricopeptide (TPR) repeat protein
MIRQRRTVAAFAVAAFLRIVAAAEEPVPEPNLERLEPGVQERMQTARNALLDALENPELDSAERARLYGETGKVFHAHHAFEVAAACYRNAAELDPEDVLWPYLLGFLYQDSGRFDLSRAHYEKVLETEPEHTFATLRLAQVHLELNELDAAEPMLRKVLEEPGLEATAHEALGKIETARENPEEAIRHYEAALEVQPEASRLHVPLGLAYRGLGEIEKAREHLGQAGQAKIMLPDPYLREIGSLSVSSEMFLSLATQAIKAGNLDRAERAYRGALAVNPENARAHVNLAEILTRRGALEEAEARLREALRLDPESFFATFNLANLFELRGDLEEAIPLFERALEKDPTDVKANYRYAGALMKIGDYERAVPQYGKVVELAPGFVHARYLQALALIAQNDHLAAQDVLEEALEVKPDDPDLMSALARLLATNEPIDGEGAQRALEMARTLFDSRRTGEDLETLAMALAASGRFDEAIRAQLTVIEAAESQEDPEGLPHLEYNLSRYRQGLPSDRPWRLEESAAEPPSAEDDDDGGPNPI